MASDGDGCCFDDWARSDLKRANRGRTADAVTTALIDAVDDAGLHNRSLLDVGCGAGALALRAVEHGASRATGVDLGAGAIEVARTLAAQRELAWRTDFRVADAAVDPLTGHDVVALNRVICCYRDFENLVTNTTGAAREIYAYVVPRSTGPVGWLNRVLLASANTWFRLRRRHYGGYRAFVHDVSQIRRQVEAAGFRARAHRPVHVIWQLDVFERETHAA